MNQRIKTFIAAGLLALALFGAARAGPLEDGQAAYQKGDFATASQIWRSLADQGDANAQVQLGSMYQWGREGGARSYAEAAKSGTVRPPTRGTPMRRTSLRVMYDH